MCKLDRDTRPFAVPVFIQCMILANREKVCALPKQHNYYYHVIFVIDLLNDRRTQ